MRPVTNNGNMHANIFRYLSYAGLILGVILSFSVLRWGALCFLFSIACAHLSGTAKAEMHFKSIHETQFMMLSLLGQMNKRLEDDRETASLPGPSSKSAPLLKEHPEA